MTDIKLSLAAARVNAGLTQDDVANSLGTSVQTILNWEKGRSEPTISQARALSKLYGVDMDVIFFDD